jgi:hypothetical protein
MKNVLMLMLILGDIVFETDRTTPTLSYDTAATAESATAEASGCG